jgi:hypothetical protein
LDFKCAALIIKNKEHLKEDRVGLKDILLLKKKMDGIKLKIKMGMIKGSRENRSKKVE